MFSERLLWCRRLTWGPHCQDTTEANRLVRLFVTWELSFYVCLLKMFFKNLLVCHMVLWIFVCTKPEEGKQNPETTNNTKNKKSRMQLCHSNFSFVFGLSWTIKIITTKASNTWKLAHSAPKNPAWRICRKIDIEQLGRHENIFLHSVSAWFLLHFCLDFFFKGSFHAYGTLDWLLAQTLRKYQYQWEITGMLTP